MRRAGLIALIVVPWALLAILAWNDLRRMDFFGFDAATHAHTSARQAFFTDLAYEGCVPRDAVIAASGARGWATRPVEDFNWCHAPQLSDWLAVEIDPPLPFSTDDENTAFIGFDENGCMARWEYTACD